MRVSFGSIGVLTGVRLSTVKLKVPAVGEVKVKVVGLNHWTKVLDAPCTMVPLSVPVKVTGFGIVSFGMVKLTVKVKVAPEKFGAPATVPEGVREFELKIPNVM